MSDFSNFSTTILTSKTPQQSASLVNEGVKQTNQLVSNNLINFFDSYSSILQRNNHELKKLVDANGNSITSLLNTTKEFGITTQIWDNYMNALKNEIYANDQLIRFLKLEIVGPLINLVKQDARFSELLANNNELLELVTQQPLNEYKWNTSSIQILNNFENYKKHEKNVLFSTFLNLFNLQGSALDRGIKINESSTNYLLNNFNIDREMDTYLKTLLDAKQPPLVDNKKAAHPVQPPVVKPKKSNRQSKLFHSNTDTSSLASDKEKKKNSRLKSRVGSIFGRKQKTKKSATTIGGIPELESIHSATTANTNMTNLTSLRNERTRDELSRDNTPAMSHPPTFHDRSAEPSQFGSRQPSQPVVPAPPSKERDLPLINAPQLEQPQDASPAQSPPNVVKYDNDSSDQEVDGGNQLSMLQQQEFQQSPAGLLNTAKSRHTQYSFESGDDDKPIATSPRAQRTEKFELPEPDLTSESPNQLPVNVPVAVADREPVVAEHPAPLPPPSRRVAHRDTTPAQKRSEVNSQIFHSLPNARESVFVAPAPLTTQTTGTSLLNKHDIFNHAQLNSDLKPGLNISISSVVNVNFKSEQLAKSSVVGEIAFNYQGQSADRLSIKIPDNHFDKTILNTSFVEKTSDEDFILTPNFIANKTLGGIKYMQQNLNLSQIPIFVHSVWKFEEHQSSLLINLNLNPKFTSSSVTVSNLVVSVALDKSVETTSASSRPQGSFNKDRSRITWRFTEPVTLSESSGQKLIARFMTSGQGKEEESGIQLKFSIQDITSPLEVLEANQQLTPKFNLIAGNYSANT